MIKERLHQMLKKIKWNRICLGLILSITTAQCERNRYCKVGGICLTKNDLWIHEMLLSKIIVAGNRIINTLRVTKQRNVRLALIVNSISNV